MWTYDEAVGVAAEFAKRDDRAQVIAEAVPGAERGDPRRFVVGPARGWDPPADRWRVVSDVDRLGAAKLRLSR